MTVATPANTCALPAVRGIVETCINVANVPTARQFYQSVLGLEAMTGDDRFCALKVGGDVLLLFARGECSRPSPTAGGMIPPHDTSGAGHLAFAISPDSLDVWRAHLQDCNVVIESEVRWERGGISLYFRDRDNNLVELVTPGIWLNY
jgi:catechol 2,3-dioxygenase-like lactoylglutathione lyase family enzyme